MHRNGRFSITPEEYQAIPPTLQRKCFSTLERLRYAEAQTSVDASPKTSNLDRVNSRTIITGQSISRLRESIKSLSLLHSTSNQLLPPGSAYTIANVTQEDALWFSKLPDKVKRGYFSIAEEKLLSVETNSKSIDTDPYKVGKLSNQSLPSLETPSSGPSSPDGFTLRSFETEVMDTGSLKSFRSTTTDAISMDDYHKMLAQAKVPNYPPRRSSSAYSLRPSIAMSEVSTIESEGVATPSADELHFVPITKLPAEEMLDDWGSGWAPMPSKSTRRTRPSKLQTIHSREASIVLSEQFKNGGPAILPRISSSRACPSIDSAPAPQVKRWPSGKAQETPKSVAALKESAAYYLDPEARLKLRMYLASASKFDEVVEFGFPSLPTEDETTSVDRNHSSTEAVRPQTVSQMEFHIHGSRLQKTNKPTRAGTADGPPAPHESSDIYSIPYKSLPDQDPILSRDPRSRIQAQLRKLDRDPFRCSTEREMTIRMTLTRPDLRADESVLYAQTQNIGKDKSSISKIDDALHLDSLRAFANPSNFAGHRAFSLKRLLKRN